MSYRINVKNFKYAPVSADTAESYTLGTIVPVPGLMSIDLTMGQATGELYGDGALSSKLSKLTGATLKIGMNKLPLKDRAVWLGSTVTNGIMNVKTSDTPAKIAVYFEVELDDGGKEAIWLLSGKADPLGLSAKQAESNINYSTDDFTINFIKRAKDDAVYKYADTNDAEFTSAYQAAFALSPDPTVSAGA